jgi:hypothetical protein
MFYILLDLSLIYMFMFSITPIIWQATSTIPPFNTTRSGYLNIMSLNDLTHVAIITMQMMYRPWRLLLPYSTIIYFILDIVFHTKVFASVRLYLLHHLLGIFQLVVVVYLHEEKWSFCLWVIESALIPICVLDILKISKLPPPRSLQILRPIWYFISRIYAYGSLAQVHPVMLKFCAPLLLHNIDILNKQICVAFRSRA